METLMLVNPRKRHSRKYRRSGGALTRSLSIRNVQPMLIAAGQGAAGALAVNAVLRFLPMPALLTQGRMIYLTRAALSLGLGIVAGNFFPRAWATRMAEGALTVVAVDVLRDVILNTTGVSLAGAGYYSPARTVGPLPSRRMAGAAGTGKYLTAVPTSPTMQGAGKYLSNAGRYVTPNGYAVR